MKLDMDAITELFEANNDQRVQSFAEIMSDEKELWGLCDDSGWLMMEQDSQLLLPLWPLEEIAQAWAQEQGMTYTPTKVTWETWRTEWVPGLLKNNTKVVVCPNLSETHLSLDADEFSTLISD